MARLEPEEPAPMVGVWLYTKETARSVKTARHEQSTPLMNTYIHVPYFAGSCI